MNLNSKKNITRLVKMLVAGCIFVFAVRFILINFDAKDIPVALMRMKWLLFIPANAVLLLLYWWVRTLRWRTFLVQEGLEYSLLELFRVNVVSLTAGVVSPAQSGEALKIGMLHVKASADRKKLALIFFVEKLLDVAFMFLFLLSFLLVSDGALLGGKGVVLVMIVTGVTVLALGISAKLKYGHGLWIPILYTILSWLLIVAVWQVSLVSVECIVSGGQIIFLVGGTMVASMLSLMPAGIGAADVSAYEILKYFGVGSADARYGVIALRLMGSFMFLFGLFVSCVLKFSWGDHGSVHKG